MSLRLHIIILYHIVAAVLPASLRVDLIRFLHIESTGNTKEALEIYFLMYIVCFVWNVI